MNIRVISASWLSMKIKNIYIRKKNNYKIILIPKTTNMHEHIWTIQNVVTSVSNMLRLLVTRY